MSRRLHLVFIYSPLAGLPARKKKARDEARKIFDPGTGAEKMYTLAATGFAGPRPWRDGELNFNPEMAQGVPFSTNLVGLGGFSNGEITRAAGTNPTLYRQRLFPRQTWNQGGGSQPVESGLNQLAGSVDENRFVLTAGNFSTLDVFDPNTYAKDSRVQFMNWSHWTHAADALGLGWGFAAEWYRDDWVPRLCRMSGPRAPNGLPSDLALGKHYGDQVEVEHARQLGGQPGKALLLGWRNRVRPASFKDALDYLRANPGADPQTFFKARGIQSGGGQGSLADGRCPAHSQPRLRRRSWAAECRGPAPARRVLTS